MTHPKLPTGTIFLAGQQGRLYDLGSMKATFKADEEETRQRYCISEWWLNPQVEGPGAHLHENNEDIFYVLEGTLSIFWVKSGWMLLKERSFVFPRTHSMILLTAQTSKSVS